MDNRSIETPLERAERFIARSTPEPKDFGRIYDADDIESDIKEVEDFKQTPNYKEKEKRTDSVLLETTFINRADQDDWFGEGKSYFDDPEWQPMINFPTSEADDYFHHIDVISVINNETTGHEAMPFAIDLTYNITPDDLKKKFGWTHVYGKTDNAPEGVSEFGYSGIKKDKIGNDYIDTWPLARRFRRGLKIPGFASAKYFEDKNDPWNPVLEKGRIEMMPRFVVGYSTELSDQLAAGMPSHEFKMTHSDADYQRKVTAFQKAATKAKWCTLVECAEQAAAISGMLDALTPEETAKMDPDELSKAKKQVAIMKEYFDRALAVAKEQAKTDPEEAEAMAYADRDETRQMIAWQCRNTYNEKQW